MRGLFGNLFQKWVIVFSTQHIGDYYKVRSKLHQHNIDYQTETVTFKGSYSGRNRHPTTYHLKVKEKDVQKTDDIIDP
ncbi:hypothetical protein FH966_03675 [Lentibacillus cibarius]|uniref:Uncharacterized protein n=1 Tax=Lentibacillus cibarius TaxID=2583219 RepID=A0A549YG70_9BACI|nr:hypothetical protein [Lentibacillus cibarius]TRM10889.1 hypothetical protein FH966_03675 [Lentibacillus cibarius]